jgi:hypothetical protein
MSGTSSDVIGLRLLGAAMALFSWYTVLFNVPVVWKGSRAPMSQRSQAVFACASTAWFLAVCGIYPLICAWLFAISILCSFALGDQDRKTHVVQHGSVERRVLTAEQTWLGFCVFDALVLFPSLFAFFRDLLVPPVTEEQIIVHRIGLAMLAIGTTGAVTLYVKRPRNSQ